jgi:phosphopantetheinyl transferase
MVSRLWTKEAVLKAAGNGIFRELDLVDVWADFFAFPSEDWSIRAIANLRRRGHPHSLRLIATAIPCPAYAFKFAIRFD